MKYLDEYRDADLVKHLIRDIHENIRDSWSVMEICGGQTHSLVRNGIIDLLPDNITMVHGPGCPVCVTPTELIDQAIHIAELPGSILCSFGDMLRVPGSKKSLLRSKAEGGDVRIVYSPLDAVRLAQANPDKKVVFFAVGFETTAPANALSVLQAQKLGLHNYFILTSHVLVPPAIKALLKDKETSIDGFLAAGHVCTVMGTNEYIPIVKRFHVPIVVTGFEPVDLLKGLYSCLHQLENGEAFLENQYKRAVTDNGNPQAREMMETVFEVTDRNWRGIGVIPASGYGLRPEYEEYDATKRFEFSKSEAQDNPGCIAGEILKGLKKPFECPEFGKRCTPENPLGAPMVSAEGACAAYFNFSTV